MTNPTMSLEEFRASGEYTSDLSKFTDIGDWQGAGRVYADWLVIQPMPTGSAEPWCLTIGNDSHAGELATLEGELYAWALGEGVFDERST